jgi:hypothetical protein
MQAAPPFPVIPVAKPQTSKYTAPMEQKEPPSTKLKVPPTVSSCLGTYPFLECNSVGQDAAETASKIFRQASP